MDFVHVVAVFLDHVNLSLVPCELGEHALRVFEGRLVVGVGDVGDGDALGAVLLADPVGVGQVDADGGGGVAGAGQGHGVDDLRGDALHLGLPEPRIHRRMVLEPLGVGAEHLGTGRRGRILHVHDGFPGGLAAQRVVIVFDEPVGVVHYAEGVLDPQDVIVVPGTEVTALVIGYELVDALFLEVVLGEFPRLAQLAADALDGGGVDASHLPFLFHEPAVLPDHLAVEAVGNGVRIALTGLGGVESVHLAAGHSLAVEVHRRFSHNVLGAVGAAPLRVDVGVVDDVQHLRRVEAQPFRTGPAGLTLHGQFAVLRDVGQERCEVLPAACREELVLGVVVMYAVREEDSLGVHQEILPVFAAALSAIVVQYVFDGVPDGQVVAAVLVPGDVTAELGGL